MKTSRVSKKTVQLILIGIMVVLIAAAFIMMNMFKDSGSEPSVSDYIKAGDEYMQSDDLKSAYASYKSAYNMDNNNTDIIYKLLFSTDSDEEKHILAYRYLDLSVDDMGNEGRKAVFSYLFDSSGYNGEAYNIAMAASEEFEDFLSSRIEQGLVNEHEYPELKDDGLVYFGTYPQSKINNEELIAYLKQAEFDKNGFTEIYGRKYYMYNDGSNESFYAVEAIAWMVLMNEDSTYQLITSKVLDCECVMEDIADSSWDMCHLREWVNTEFREKAFTDDEYSQLIMQFVEDPDNYCYGSSIGEDSEDYIIILSCIDLVDEKYGFRNKDEMEDDRRIAYCTDYAAARGVFPDDEMRAKYWTSSNGSMNTAYVYVNSNGIISVGGGLCTDRNTGVRPVITVKI